MTTNFKEIKIYSFFYHPEKVFDIGDEYINIWAGKSNLPEIEGFIGDDTGDNISSENRFFSELTGLYWIWKNTNAEVVGSCHYRRFFTTAEFPIIYKIKNLLYYPLGLQRKRKGLIYTKNLDYWIPLIIRKQEINGLLSTYDIILPQHRQLKYSVFEHYKRYHHVADIYLIKEIIKEKTPEYLISFENVMNGRKLYANNMFIMPRFYFNLLMEWVFGVLFEFKNRIEAEEYKGYQQRVFGFISERLITIWFEYMQLNYVELPLIYFKSLKNKLK